MLYTEGLHDLIQYRLLRIRRDAAVNSAPLQEPAMVPPVRPQKILPTHISLLAAHCVNVIPRQSSTNTHRSAISVVSPQSSFVPQAPKCALQSPNIRRLLSRRKLANTVFHRVRLRCERTVIPIIVPKNRLARKRQKKRQPLPGYSSFTFFGQHSFFFFLDTTPHSLQR
jgi:hypothetical protein